jgi:hypothetical protein
VSDDKRVELWLPTSVTKVTVSEGKVTVWDEMTMEKQTVKRPAGFDNEKRDDA